MQLLDRLGIQQWVYARPKNSNDLSPVDSTVHQTIVNSNLGDHQIRTEWSEWMGGRPMRIRVSDTSDGYDVQLLNNRGGQGREFSHATFYVEEVAEGAFNRNPNDGGSIFAADVNFGNEGDPFPGYLQQHIGQGAPIARPLRVVDLGSGEHTIESNGIPLEWVSIAGQVQGGQGGGSMYDPLIFPDFRAWRRFHTHWNGNKAITKVVAATYFENEFQVREPGSNNVWGPSFLLTFGWDESHIYDETNGWTEMTDLTMASTLNDTGAALTSVTLFTTGVVQVIFAASKGRVTNDRHLVTLSGFPTSPIDINGTFNCNWSSDDRFNIGGFATGNSGDYGTSGTVSSTDYKWHTFNTDNQTRSFFGDKVECLTTSAPLAGGDTQYLFDVTSKGVIEATGRKCIALRSLSAGGEAWTHGEDLAFGYYMKEWGTKFEANLTGPSGAPLGGNHHAHLHTVRNASAPVNDEKETNSNIFFASIRSHQGQKPMPRGWQTDVVFILIGTWAEVQAAVTTLDAQPDSIFDKPRGFEGP